MNKSLHKPIIVMIIVNTSASTIMIEFSLSLSPSVYINIVIAASLQGQEIISANFVVYETNQKLELA